MEDKKYSVGDIYITIKGDKVWAKISLETTTGYDKLSKLNEMLQLLQEAGFYYYFTGYVESHVKDEDSTWVESIYLEFV